MDYFNHNNPFGERGCASYVLAVIIGIVLCAIFARCTTPKTIERQHHHHYEADTMAVQAAVDTRLSSWQQQMDSMWHQRFSILSMDLSHSLHETEVTTETITTATDSLGRTLRTEQRTISRDISSEQHQMEQRLTSEYETRLRLVVDSVNDIWQSKFNALQGHWEQTNSTSHTKTPVADSRPWYQRIFNRFHYIINGFLVAAVLWLTRRWWLRPILKKWLK